jgi:hypothetical protein
MFPWCGEFLSDTGRELDINYKLKNFGLLDQTKPNN